MKSAARIRSFASALVAVAGTLAAQGTAAAVTLPPQLAPSPFVLACTPTSDDAATIPDYNLVITSLQATYRDGSLTLRLNPNGDERIFAADAADATLVDALNVKGSWSDDDTWFTVASQDGRHFTGELIYVEDFLVPVSCVKVATDQRDEDEFTLVCTPTSADAADIPDYGLVIRDVVLSYEDRDLEMRVNASTATPQIFDLERSSNVVVTANEVSAAWENDDTWFSATSQDGVNFDAELIYVEDFAVPLTCTKI